MWKAFLRYRQLDREARQVFWSAYLLLLRVGFSLRRHGFQRTRKRLAERLGRESAGVRQGKQNPDDVPRVCRMLNAAARYSFGHPTCLEQSLVLWYLLQRRGVSANLRIGVKKSNGNFEAHAWVELEGTALNQTADAHQHYAAFDGEFASSAGENA